MTSASSSYFDSSASSAASSSDSAAASTVNSSLLPAPDVILPSTVVPDVVAAPAPAKYGSKETERAWLYLANVQLTPRLANLLLECFGGDPRAIFAATDAELEDAGCPPPPLARIRDPEFVPTSKQEIWLDRPDVQVLWQAHPDYPRMLRDIPGTPPVLFVRGELREADRLGVGIVGSRRATPYGRSVAHKLARELTAHGLTIISGGAIGIDTAAHQGALDGGGRTLVILGCGLDIDYPQPNRALFERIVTSASGALVSEYPFGSQPENWRFPQRNRVISGLSQGIIVVEAPESSGALNTVRHALDQDRVVMSVPGNIDRPASIGTNTLIKEGAVPITETADVLHALNMIVVPASAQHQRAFELPFDPESSALEDNRAEPSGSSTRSAAASRASISTPAFRTLPDASADQQKLLACLSLTPRHIDTLAQEAGMTAVQVGVEMTLLELSGHVRRLPGNSYIRTA